MMTWTDAALPKAVSRDEWLAARKALLANEKALTRHRDAVNAERRRLPMVRIDKPYVFDGALRRQEDWEEPPGRSDGPFMHWLRRHDRYAPDVVSGRPAARCESSQ